LKFFNADGPDFDPLDASITFQLTAYATCDVSLNQGTTVVKTRTGAAPTDATTRTYNIVFSGVADGQYLLKVNCKNVQGASLDWEGQVAKGTGVAPADPTPGATGLRQAVESASTSTEIVQKAMQLVQTTSETDVDRDWAADTIRTTCSGASPVLACLDALEATITHYETSDQFSSIATDVAVFSNMVLSPDQKAQYAVKAAEIALNIATPSVCGMDPTAVSPGIKNDCRGMYNDLFNLCFSISCGQSVTDELGRLAALFT